MSKLAIITSHPIQYYAPWFKYITEKTNLQVKVFYLWNFGINETIDREFKQSIKWDIPLLDGYNSEFVENISQQPGTNHVWGLQNPSLLSKVNAYHPNAVMLIGYNYASLYRFIFQWNNKNIPLIFRGDSHRLFARHQNWKEKFKRQFISLIYSKFAAMLYVGKANYEYFRYYQVAQKKLFFAPHAVDNQRFITTADDAVTEAAAWKQELGITQNHRVILFAGKFNLKKRPLDLLLAYKQASLDRVSLLFVGAGELEAELKKQAINNPNIYFAPFQNQKMMPRTYAIADLFILPSYGDSETWGLAVNEAMCLSCPIIVSSHVGCGRDLVHHDRNGLIFPAGDIDALVNCLKIAFNDDIKLHQWGRESQKIIADYSYLQTIQGLLDSLDNLKISY
jgi:glycosyltransferase involved in cell wall biosynthesis